MKSQVSMDPVDLALLPVKHEVSADPMDLALLVKHNIQNSDTTANIASGPVITTCYTDAGRVPGLVLFQPLCLTLPNNQVIVTLLKALSMHLTGRYLVTTVIQCAEYHETDTFTEQIKFKRSNFGKHLGKYECG